MKVKVFPETGRKVWMAFAVLFVISQAANFWALFPEYSGWNSFGFPLIYLQHNASVGYFYFNFIFLLADMLVWYFVASFVVYGYRQLNKFKIIG
jgi:hypothetical protein